MVCISFAFVCNANGYGGSGGGGGYGSGGGGYGGGASSSAGAAAGGLVSGFGGGPVTAAVQSSHTVEIRHVNVPHESPQPQIVEVEAGNLPLTIHFKSASSALNVVQTHQPGQAGEAQHTSSEDEPHLLVHEVKKPVIQEVSDDTDIIVEHCFIKIILYCLVIGRFARLLPHTDVSYRRSSQSKKR